MEIWINPSCSKCRVAKSELDDAGIEYTERRYLDDVPTAAELAEVLDRMGLQPWDVARAKETKEAGIDLPKDADHRDDWLAAMVAAPAHHPAPDHHPRRRHHGDRARRGDAGRRGPPRRLVNRRRRHIGRLRYSGCRVSIACQGAFPRRRETAHPLGLPPWHAWR